MSLHYGKVESVIIAGITMASSVLFVYWVNEAIRLIFRNPG